MLVGLPQSIPDPSVGLVFSPTWSANAYYDQHMIMNANAIVESLPEKMWRLALRDRFKDCLARGAIEVCHLLHGSPLVGS